MAFAVVLGSCLASSKAAGTTVAASPTANFVAGNLVVVVVGLDNNATADGNTSEISSITDSVGGNTWTKLREFCNAQGAANAGATVSIWYSILTNTITTAGTITATLANSKTAKAFVGRQFSLGAGSTISIAGSQDLAFDAAAPSGVTLSGLASKEYLFIVGSAVEDPSTAGTFTNYTTTQSGTTGGSGASNMNSKQAYRILTATTDSPAQSAFVADDIALVYLAIEEVVAAAPKPRPIMRVMQAVNRASRY